MKYVYKLTPVSVYDIRGVESWLEDMARRGLSLKRLRPTFSTFEPGPSQSIRFRVEPFRRAAGDEPPQAMLELYQDFGWELAGEVLDLLIFSTQDPDAPEPHSDPALQGEVWNKLYRTKRRSFFLSLFLALVVAVCAFLMLFEGDTPVLNLLTTHVWLEFVLAFLLLFSIPQSWADVQRLALTVQQLEEGVPLDHRTVYPRRRWSEVVTLVFASTMLVLLAVSQFILPFAGGDIRPLDQLTAFPLLTLESLEGDSFEPTHYLFDRSPSLDRDGQVRVKDYGNFCQLERFPLCWNQWEAVQTGHVDVEDWRRLDIAWYDLPGFLSFLSAPLARELLDSAMGLGQDIWWTGDSAAVWAVDYYPYEGTSLLAVASRSDGQFHIAAAAAGDKAVLVRYTGQGDLGEHLEEIVEMVQPPAV